VNEKKLLHAFGCRWVLGTNDQEQFVVRQE
jgi:hypothetical protein